MPGLPEEQCITMGGTGQWHQSCSGFVIARNVPAGNYSLWFRAQAGTLGGATGYSNGNSGRRLLVEVFPEE